MDRIVILWHNLHIPGISSDNKSVAFINLREIRDIKFGTKGPQTYNDLFYGTDLEIFAYGSFTVKITDPEVFIKNYVPANVSYYTFDDPKVRTREFDTPFHNWS